VPPSHCGPCAALFKILTFETVDKSRLAFSQGLAWPMH
jgi:hypothetical protein